MNQPLKVLFIASEASPFCKTGGLADVMGALPRVLRDRGHDVRLLLPRYEDIDQSRFRFLPLMPELVAQYADRRFVGSVLRCNFPKSDMPVYFLDEPILFGRPGIYGDGRFDFPDNHVRFAVFNLAALWMLKGLDWQPDIIHCNDWQTGLVPALLRHHPVISADPFWSSIKTVFSIHNLAYQGNFDKYLIPAVGLPWDVFTHDGLEFYNKASFMKSALVYSDKLHAVSPTYAEEIQVDGQGAGMEGTLRGRANDLHGILNGIDQEEWDPETDAHIACNYGPSGLEGKAACTRALRERFALPDTPEKPLVVSVSRMVAAKGFDLISDALERLLELDAQFVFLGSGDPLLERALTEAAAAAPDRLAVTIGYDVPLSHQMVAGGDLFLMPSYYEPCGLTQMYAMRYGTVPVVRRTGGLADSVDAITPGSLRDHRGTGFAFEPYTPEALVETLREAIALRSSDKPTWREIQHRAMARDFSWSQSAASYEQLYQALTAAP